MPKKNTVGVRMSPDQAAVAVIWLREKGFLNAASHPHPIAKRVAALMKRLQKISKTKRSSERFEAVEIAFDRQEAALLLSCARALSRVLCPNLGLPPSVDRLQLDILHALSKKRGPRVLKGCALDVAIARKRGSSDDGRHLRRLRSRRREEQVRRARGGILSSLAF